MANKYLIIIVEDNEDFQNLYGMVAEIAGFEVEHIYTGGEALERLEREPIPAFLLLDSRLPQANGDEILRAARAKEAWAGVQIYMITADLRAVQQYKTIPLDAPRANGVIEKGAESIHKLRELFAGYKEKNGD